MTNEIMMFSGSYKTPEEVKFRILETTGIADKVLKEQTFTLKNFGAITASLDVQIAEINNEKKYLTTLYTDMLKRASVYIAPQLLSVAASASIKP
jgi:hypothetical protein